MLYSHLEDIALHDSPDYTSDPPHIDLYFDSEVDFDHPVFEDYLDSFLYELLDGICLWCDTEKEYKQKEYKIIIYLYGIDFIPQRLLNNIAKYL